MLRRVKREPVKVDQSLYDGLNYVINVENLGYHPRAAISSLEKAGYHRTANWVRADINRLAQAAAYGFILKS